MTTSDVDQGSWQALMRRLALRESLKFLDLAQMDPLIRLV